MTGLEPRSETESVAVSSVAVCVCTRNRPSELKRALQSIAECSTSPGLVLVSDDSDPPLASATLEVCQAFNGIEYIQGPRRGLAANRNNCLSRVPPAIEFILFLDDDAMLTRNFLPIAVEAGRTSPATIVTGWERKNGQQVEPRNLSFWGYQQVPPRGPDDVHAININSTIFPRALFDVIRFDENLRYGSDEIDVCGAAEKVGFRIRYLPDTGNDHIHSSTNRGEYARVVDASRLYATYKRYRWIEERRLKAVAFAILAPLQLLASTVKSGRIDLVTLRLRAIVLAGAYLRNESRRRKMMMMMIIMGGSRHP